VVYGRAPARRGHGFAATVTELALLLVVEAGAGMMGEGSHERASGRPPDLQTVRGPLVEPLRLVEVLGLRCAGGDWRTRWVFSHHHPDHTLNAALSPAARFHDHWAVYHHDLWTDRRAEGVALSSPPPPRCSRRATGHRRRQVG
jgi:glyoxylase-like metal-dependent hydrolase (beta-lactamase superfamily II)